MYVDVVAEREMRKKEFFERVYDGATALATSPSEGGLGIDAAKGEIIGIFSPNCIVGIPRFTSTLMAILIFCELD